LGEHHDAEPSSWRQYRSNLTRFWTDSREEPAISTERVTADGRVLADGNEIPLLGLGVWQVPNGPECVNAVRWALETGYRHVDTAQLYGNEESVGRGLRES
jgi:hypothetical protein